MTHTKGHGVAGNIAQDDKYYAINMGYEEPWFLKDEVKLFRVRLRTRMGIEGRTKFFSPPLRRIGTLLPSRFSIIVRIGVDKLSSSQHSKRRISITPPNDHINKAPPTLP